MANPREVRGWAVTALGGSIAYTAFGVRMWAVVASPAWPVPVEPTLLVVAFLGVAVAAAGLREALWYFLVEADGVSMYAASLLLIAAGTLHLFQIPMQTDSSFMLGLFMAAMLEWMAVPLLSYRSRPALAAVGVMVVVIVVLTAGFTFLPAPFAAAVVPWSWSPLAARIMELAALGAIGNMLLVVRHVAPGPEGTGRPA